MKGKVYGIGVGPGDPELLTLKAVSLIKENEVFAVPGSNPRESVAYKIAATAVPELAGKELIALEAPMVRDREEMRKAHSHAARQIGEVLDSGRNVVYLTLGDVSIYCTFTYISRLLEDAGYEVELVPGIPSFCAAAAKLHTPLAEWDEPLHIVPALHNAGEALKERGNFVLMKSGSHIGEIKEALREKGLQICAAENCGMPGEKLYSDLSEIPDDAGYFTLVIAKGL